MTTFERYEKALKDIHEHMKGPWSHAVVSRLAEDALYPPPEYEEVEVVRWECERCGHVYPDSLLPRRDFPCQEPDCGGDSFIKLTGTLRRPKPQKVERSVSVDVKIGDGISYAAGSCLRTDVGVSRWEFSDHPECHGKTGLLTFTWTEGEGK